MGRILDQVIGDLSASERTKIRVRSAQLVAEELSLRDLRRKIGKSQEAVARRARVGQDAISKLETRGDMRISTLRGFVEAMGGQLDLVARFPKRPPVRVALSPARNRGRKTSRRATA